MDNTFTTDDIKKICGAVSFKKGVEFLQAGQVTLENVNPEHCEAVVAGREDFHVAIHQTPSAAFGIRTSCSCPNLASVKYKCQHVAAVLLAIQQQQGSFLVDPIKDQTLSNHLVTLFDQHAKRQSGQQRHFENRQLLDVTFLCQPYAVDKGQYIIGIAILIGSHQVRHIQDFLQHVKTGTNITLSSEITYDANCHYFMHETDKVIQQLIQMSDDMLLGQTDSQTSGHTLPIPPSAWKKLAPLLSNAPQVKLMDEGNIVNGFHVVDQSLGLQFMMSDRDENNFQLRIHGLEKIKLLHAYHACIYGGELIQLSPEDSSRLVALQQMTAGNGQIFIASTQVDAFLEKVVPGLKRLGHLHLPESITKQMIRTPLIAKLYLDRVHNRLLASLEFHYDGIVFNPLQIQEAPSTAMLVRDMEKEDAILQCMQASGFTETESGFYMQNEELEYAFLYHQLPVLEKQAKVYATTAVRNRVLKEKARPQIRVKLKKERVNWLAFSFEIDGIPDQQIKEILQALEQKRTYYRLSSGSLLSLETREFEEIHRFLHAAQPQDAAWESKLNLPFLKGFRLLDGGDVFQFDQSLHQFLQDLQKPDQQAFDVPEQLQTILYDYQKQGYLWMKTIASHGFGGILADDMGLGKTLQSIAFILSNLPAMRQNSQPALIICPSSLTYNWLQEMAQFAPALQAVVMDGNQAKRIAKRNDAMNKDVVITSYPLLRADVRWYEKQQFHTVFYDEAQAFKNPITQTARAVKKIQAAHRFALTGTPMENSLVELWAIFHVVFPELLQGLKEYSNLPRKTLIRRTRPFLLRRTKAEVVAELPEKVRVLDSAELLLEQKKLYAAYLAKLRHDTLKHLDQDTLRKNRIKILAGLTRLRQICCHPALFIDGYQGGSAKFEQLLQIVAEARNAGRRMLIFSQFTEMLKLIGKELAVRGMSFFYLDGHTPSEERLDRCGRFNVGERSLFLISLKAGGTGLNLTGADTVILYDNWWNPAVEEQAADRAHRIGQKKAVQVIKLVARGTIEEKMNALQEKKRHLVAEVIDAKAEAGPILTEEDIREILMI